MKNENCFFCKGEMKEDITTFMADLGKCIVIIRNVPCLKCSQCGEELFTDEVAKNIEKIVSKLKESVTEIAVTDYKTAA